MQSNMALIGQNQTMESDLGPLAWVLDELRKSLDSAISALRRFVRDAQAARGSDIAALDASQLRIARQQLHQAVGALEMVGLEIPAKMLRAMQSLAQKFVQRPDICSEEAALKLERASFALTDYLDGLLKGRSTSSVALFAQYRDVLVLLGEDRIHPADLWAHEWRWIDVPLAATVKPLAYDASVCSRIDSFVLNIVKAGHWPSARIMCDISLGFAAAQTDMHTRVFWCLASAYFEIVASGQWASDLYVKRAASNVLSQYRSLARGSAHVSDRLAHDLLFFCAQTEPVQSSVGALPTIRAAYGLLGVLAPHYDEPCFGRYDPTLLTQARKRIAALIETWSALAGGDVGRMKTASDQFTLVTDSIVKLHPDSRELAATLSQSMALVARSGQAPSPELAMEVATAVLYLDAAYADMDTNNDRLLDRGRRLAERLEAVLAGAQPEPLDSWMEELYRRVSDRQVMGSVVQELSSTLAELEAKLDAFFRNPKDKTGLHDVPGQLSQMRGVFSVLGLDQAALAALRMRTRVEQCLMDDVDTEAARTNTFEKLGNSLGALGFLIDMLGYQRELAKKLFVYDEDLGEFKSLMGRQKVSVEAVSAPEPVAPVADVVPVTSAVPAEPVKEDEHEEDEEELRNIFLDEARDVVQSGLATLSSLTDQPSDFNQQTSLRRAFHTLKGSARMVGLNEFGEAAWAFEQLMNAWLPQQKRVSDDLLHLAGHAMQGFECWVADIALQQDTAWSAQPFRQAADLLRIENVYTDLHLPKPPTAQPPGEPAVTDQPTPEPISELPQSPALEPEPIEEISTAFLALDFDMLPDSTVSVAPSVLEALPEPEVATKTIGSLSVNAGLLDVYLEEADQWSNRLLAELTEWSQEQDQHLQDSTVGLAHSLAGSSATVGFLSLSELSRALEYALMHIQRLDAGPTHHAPLLIQTAESIHSLLHQFAAGFMKTAHPDQIQALRDLLNTELPASAHMQTDQDNEVVQDESIDLDFDFPTFEPEPLPERQPDLESEPTHSLVVHPLEPDLAFESLPLSLDFPAQNQDATPQLAPELPPESALPESLPEPISPPEQEPQVTVDTSPDTVVLSPPLLPTFQDETVKDVLDVDLFPIFEEEALELLPQLSASLRQWVHHPDDHAARQSMLRDLHTLKGSARLAGAMRLGDMVHQLESAAEHIQMDVAPTVEMFLLLTRLDAIQHVFDALRVTPAAFLALPEAPSVSDLPEQGIPADDGIVFMPEPHKPALTLSPSRYFTQSTTRIRSRLLDRMVNQTGEVLISRARLESRVKQLRTTLGDLTGNLDRLRTQLRDLELQSESQMQSRQAQDASQNFDPLEFDRFTRVQELTRMMAESVHDIASLQHNLQQSVAGAEDDLAAQLRQTRDLQRDLLRTRMVEFDSIVERLHGVVRQAAKDTGKSVTLTVVGGTQEIDRSVLDRMGSTFEHLLRNAVCHGIEDEAIRVSAGKPAQGNITITLLQQGNDVNISFADDGAGLDLNRIRDKAIERGLITAQKVLSHDQLAQLIFSAGLSTASTVSELAGRGIGLDVVQSHVNAAGGRIDLSTQSGVGTRFNLVLPLTTAVTQVVMLRVGETVLGVPANLMELVKRVSWADLDTAYESGWFDYSGQKIDFFWAGALLQVSAATVEPRGKSASVVIICSANQRVALHVDEVLGNREAVVKNLGPQLSRLPGLTGMSVLSSGAVILIYNPLALVTIYGVKAHDFSRQHVQAAHATPEVATVKSQPHYAPLVLVVDDSITVRRVTQRLLKREGFRVALANDGLHALELLQQEKPSVVLTDIEMPRMDGFDLVRNIRADARLRDLPIIMITSRMAQKHRDYAHQLQIDHYLGKPYPEDELIGLVHQYCAAGLTP